MSNGPEYVRDQSFVETQLDDGRVIVQQAPLAPVRAVAPVVAMAPVATAPTMARTSYTRRVAPDAVIAAIVGLFITIVGLLAVTRGGFDGPMNRPVVDVLGFHHTTVLGLIETGIGVFLLISGASRSRSAALFFGAVLGIGAFVGAVQTKSFVNELALETGWAVLMVIAAIIVVLSALLIPRIQTRTTTVGPA
ncbi:MAG: hypothetical protein JWM34_5048 [Ilumatobacteraceae bacterium]|nr:hypothetical protein [Ilumatobacteraceae bacterium]